MSAAPEPPGIRRIARLSSRAFGEAIAELIAHAGDEAIVDVRADAYGHGATDVEARARAHGIRRFVHDGEPGLRSADGGPLGMTAYGHAVHQQPVLSLAGEVVAVKQVPAGTAVSYGYTYRTERDATLALVALGYADGVPRLASSRGPVRVGGVTGIVAGRIAMDQLVVDLGDAPAAVGDAAVLWDDTQTFAAWCAASERSAAALTAGLGRRIHRQWDDT